MGAVRHREARLEVLERRRIRALAYRENAVMQTRRENVYPNILALDAIFRIALRAEETPPDPRLNLGAILNDNRGISSLTAECGGCTHKTRTRDRHLTRDGNCCIRHKSIFDDDRVIRPRKRHSAIRNCHAIREIGKAGRKVVAAREINGTRNRLLARKLEEAVLTIVAQTEPEVRNDRAIIDAHPHIVLPSRIDIEARLNRLNGRIAYAQKRRAFAVDIKPRSRT